MKQANIAFPIMAIFTVPWFLLEVRGYSKLYDTVDQGPGLWYNYLQFPLFFLFTDSAIYWIHRGLHHPRVYKYVHKPHHKWIMPTPFASHAFHPADGYAQGLPYHIFPFIFPLSKFAYVFLFVFVNIWTVLIHDGEYAHNSPIINGAACHTMHHLYFNYNYGQYTTLWDRLGGSYRKPNDELFQKELKMCQSEWKKQAEAVGWSRVRFRNYSFIRIDVTPGIAGITPRSRKVGFSTGCSVASSTAGSASVVAAASGVWSFSVLSLS